MAARVQQFYAKEPAVIKLDGSMPSEFAPFRHFVRHLQGLAEGGTKGNGLAWERACVTALDGEAGRELIRLVPVHSRRDAGTFFTGSAMATTLAGRIRTVDAKCKIVDPALGAGDLLIAAARRMKRARSLNEMIDLLQRRFAGTDREEVFVEAARLRFLLLAHNLQRTPIEAAKKAERFQNFQKMDLFENPGLFESATDVLLNPPFARTESPSWYTHANGKVNGAAVVTSFILSHLAAGAKIHAILPEVLRTGSLYRRWRESMLRSCDVEDLKSVGLFDSADVDVFMVSLVKRRKAVVTNAAPWTETIPGNCSVGQIFRVSVGPVVEYRDPRKGSIHPYIHPRNVAAWSEVKRITERRAHNGPAIAPPFVVIRRTSRPGDRWRAAASLILGKRSVAVENHFIVCKPISGNAKLCRELMVLLKTTSVNDFLNEQMRCRHLTVRVVRSIPIPGDTTRKL